MVKVKVVDSIYLEYINHANNDFKFYRITILESDNCLYQDGDIKTEGVNQLISHNDWELYFKQKLSEGYVRKEDPTPHYIESGLNSFNLSQFSGDPPETEEEKISRISKELDKAIVVATKFQCYTEKNVEITQNIISKFKNNEFVKNREIHLVFKNHFLYILEDIRKNLIDNHKFLEDDIHLVNEICHVLGIEGK